jgi:hypothetical protein
MFLGEIISLFETLESCLRQEIVKINLFFKLLIKGNPIERY